jgi:hypothetical protein
MAIELDLMFGKVNNCLKELKIKKFLKVKNFAKNLNKSDYIYVLTLKGISEKLYIQLTS